MLNRHEAHLLRCISSLEGMHGKVADMNTLIEVWSRLKHGDL